MLLTLQTDKHGSSISQATACGLLWGDQRPSHTGHIFMFNLFPVSKMDGHGSSSSTVNASEVEKFGKLSDQWWNTNIKTLKALRSMNSIRVPWILSTICKSTPPGKKWILDIGCGGGLLSEALAQAYHDLGWRDEEIGIIGLEPSVENVGVAKAHLPPHLKGKVEYICGTIEEEIGNFQGKFDTVVMSEVIEHVDNPEGFLKWGVQAAKAGGSLILTTPAKTWLSYIGMIICAEHLMKTLPVGTHEYRKFIGLGKMGEMFRENGCEIKGVRGALYNPLTDRWAWNNFCKRVCYGVHALKTN